MYADILARVYALAPKGIRLGLDRLHLVAQRLELGERRFRCIQIAGTNGKGTTSAILAQAIGENGVRVGLFTSPHLHRFSERVRIDGEEASEEELAEHLERVLNLAEQSPAVELTFFEVATLCALSVFRAREVDYAVMEVGLGGRLDATSICDPVLTGITSIGLDHTAILGDTIAKIAREKAGICKTGTPLVTGALPPEALREVESAAARAAAPLFVLGRDFERATELEPPLPGDHHLQNTTVARELYRKLLERDSRLHPGAFARALPLVRWPARFELVEGSPRVLLDGAHNPDAAAALAASLKTTGWTPDTLIFGALRDKRPQQILDILRPLAQRTILTAPPVDRACPPQSLARKGDLICTSPEGALRAAREQTPADGLVLVTGSFFTVAAIRALLLGEPSDPPIAL